MKVRAWVSPQDQMCSIGRHSWSVPRLFELSRSLPVMDVPLNHMHLYYTYEKLTIRELVMHMKAVQDADLDCPIILDEDGEIMDGRPMIEGPVEVSIRLIVTPPASWSQKKQREALEGRIFPTTKPDIDNVVKGIFDACNEIVWKDDKQAVDVRVVKRYGQVARASVEVRAL